MQSYRQSKKLLGHVQRKVNAVGTDHHRHSGVSGKDHDANGRAQSFLVESGAAKDRTDPRTWPRIVRIRTTVITWLIVFVCGYASATDSSIMKRAAATFVVSEFAESFATPMFLFGNAFGALVSGPLSETAGRNFVYLISIPLYMICIMVTALAPSLPVQLVFRFFAGLLASPTLTIYGGSLADMWSDSERSLMWPLFATSPLLGPIVAPIPSGWLVDFEWISWRWVDWLSLIISGVAWLIALFFLPETYSPLMLTWKAGALRTYTKNDKFKSSHEMQDSLLKRLKTNLTRPLIFFAREPIVICLGFYLTMIYVLVFTNLQGFTYIFTYTYGFSPGEKGSAFGAVAIGILLNTCTQPFHARGYQRRLAALQRSSEKEDHVKVEPEYRLWSAIIAAPFLPISLFWIGWTNYSDISYWNGLAGAALFGWSLNGIFVAVYQYIIDSYETESSSALSSITFMRYIVAGGMVIADMKMYETLGVHWTMTMLGCVGIVLTPLPLLFWRFGHKVRKRSRFAQEF